MIETAGQGQCQSISYFNNCFHHSKLESMNLFKSIAMSLSHSNQNNEKVKRENYIKYFKNNLLILN